MNYYFMAAGVFLFASFLIHIIAGDKQYRQLNPRKSNIHSTEIFQSWLMGRGTFQMVSADLLLTALFLFLMGINAVPFNYYLSLFIALLYFGYLFFWLFALLFSKAKAADYLRVGQWLIFLVAFVLIILGLRNAK